MKKFIFLCVALTLCLWLLPLAAQTVDTPKPADTYGKEPVSPQTAPAYRALATDPSEPKEAPRQKTSAELPIQLPSEKGSTIKEVDSPPQGIDLHPVVDDSHEPKETDPIFGSVEHYPVIIDRNEAKIGLSERPAGQTRVDADSYEPDNTPATAQYISVNSILQSQNHTIHDFGGVDVDWYYFYGIPGRIYTFYSTSSLDIKINLYQNDGTTIIDSDDDDGEGLNFLLQYAPTSAGFYRLKVDAYYMNAGPYVFYFKTEANPDGYEIDDVAAQARNIYPTASLQTQYHTIHSNLDVDWFLFQGYTGRNYTFYSTGNTDVRVYLYAADGTTQLGFDDDSGDGNNFLLNLTPSTNSDYYLKVAPYSAEAGAYNFCFSYSANADAYEPDDSVGNSSSINGYDPYIQVQSHTLHTATDQDWFSFLALEGVHYIFFSTGNTDTQIYLYSPSNLTQPVIWDDDSGDGNNYNLTFTFTTTANYYIKVIGYGGAIGGYNFNWRHESDPDGFEPDDTPATANEQVVGQTTTLEAHNLHTPTDQDWYRFQGVLGCTYTFWSERPYDPQIFLYQNDATTLIASDDDSGDGLNFYMQFTPNVTGYYMIKVIAYGGGVIWYDFGYNYSVNADAYEPDNSATDYTDLAPITTFQFQSHTIHTSSDQDWYRFEGVAGRLYNFESTGDTDVVAYLYANDGTTLLASDDDSGMGANFQLAYNCTAAGYYKLKVVGFGGYLGVYNIYYDYGALQDAYEPDDSSTDFTDLTVTSLENSQQHTLHNSVDQDWYRFYGVAGKRYTFWSSGTTDTQIHLYQNDGITQLAYDDDNGGTPNFSLAYVFNTTAYYKLKVTGYYGAAGRYDIVYQFGAQPDSYETDDGPTDYTALTVTTALQTQNHTLHNATDQDWFRFQGIAGYHYTFYTTGTTDTRGNLYLDNGTTFLGGSDDYTDVNFLIGFHPTTTGYYKLKIDAYPGDAGPYVFCYQYATLAAPAILTITRSGTNVILAWTAVSGATSYKVYSSDNPYTGFTQTGSPVTGTTMTLAASAARRFFRVTANN